MEKNPIICAIDTVDIDHAVGLVTRLKPYIGACKLGLEFFTANGPQGVKIITDLNIPVFLDLKFLDIPTTVAKCVKAAMSLNIFMLTIHTSGGSEMMKAAIEAANDEAIKLSKAKPMIIGVTILTSMNQDNLNEIGVHNQLDDQALKLAALARNSGLDGVVCSPHEITGIRQACGGDFKLVVPGIRPATAACDDQKRVMSPKGAIVMGADYLVIGRPVTQSSDPILAIQEILREL